MNNINDYSYRNNMKAMEQIKSLKTLMEQIENVESVNITEEMYNDFDSTNIKITNVNKENKTFLKQNKSDAKNNQEDKEINDLKNHIKNIINNLSMEEYAALLAKGISLDNYGIEGMALTLKNVKEVEEALDLTKSIKDLNNNAVIYLLKNNLDPTVENLYKAQFIKDNQDVDYLIDEGKNFENLDNEIKRVLSEHNIEINDKNIDLGKWFIKNEIALTKYNFEYKQQLDNLNGYLEEEKITEKINNTINEGIEPKKAIIIGDELNYKADLDKIKFRRDLEERRLKLIFESAKNLVDKGIEIDTKPLEDIVNRLKTEEKGYLESIDKEDKEFEIFAKTINTVEEMKTIPASILSRTLITKDIETINSITEEGINLRNQYEKANETYEKLLTRPNIEYGDTIGKAFANMDSILEELNIENNIVNQRAVRILGYNSMELSRENIDNIKLYDYQVNSIINNLSPDVTMYLIHNKINPLDIPIDELNDTINLIKEEIGFSNEERYSEFLWKLEKDNNITEDERKSYIGIYRLLDKVEKSDGASLGALIKSDSEINLKNLLEMSQVRKTHIDLEINKEFGELEEVVVEGEKIIEQIQSSYISDILDTITPKKLHKVKEDLLNEFKDIMDITIESLNEKLMAQVDEEVINTKTYEKIRETLKEAADSINLIKDYKLPITFNNIAMANILNKGEDSFYKSISDLHKKKKNDKFADTISKTNNLADKLDNENLLQDIYNEIYEEINSNINEILDNEELSSEEVDNLIHIKNINKFTNTLAKKQYYQIPLEKGDEIWNINLTIINSKENKGSTSIYFTSDVLGKVNISYSINKNNFTGTILCSTRKGLDYLKKYDDNFKAIVNDRAINVKDFNYALENINKAIYLVDKTSNAHDNNVSNENLLNIAKGFINILGEMD